MHRMHLSSAHRIHLEEYLRIWLPRSFRGLGGVGGTQFYKERMEEEGWIERPLCSGQRELPAEADTATYRIGLITAPQHCKPYHIVGDCGWVAVRQPSLTEREPLVALVALIPFDALVALIPLIAHAAVVADVVDTGD